MKGFFHRHKIDIIILATLLGVALVSLIPFLANRFSASETVVATIYRQGDKLMAVDLSKEEGEREFPIQGTKTSLVVGVRKNAIKIIDSGCPSQYCVHMGYVDKPGLPIVCAYNGISIVLEGGDPYSVVIG